MLKGNDEDEVPEGVADDKVLPDFDGCGGGGSLGSCGLILDNGFGAIIIPGHGFVLGGGASAPRGGNVNFGTGGFAFAVDPSGRSCAGPMG